MAINFPTNPSDGDTVTVGTKTYSYSASKGVWKDVAGADTTQSILDNYLQVANVSSTTTVYTALSDLPMSGNDTGAQAYVSGTNRLYLWNGTGWYNIALINTNPTISGASATYNLNTDGSNTVVTLVASDPEGLPITFTASHTGLGVGANAIATVTQSNNIFTFTPTTNTALAGTFTTTFTASDGVNLAGANSSFTLAFSVNNSNYTTALITSVGTNNQVNNTFVDSSTNSHTITAVGNATQTTFSPYRHGGYSMRTTAGTSLNIPASTDNQFTGDFTIEGWVYSLDTGDKSLYVHGSYFAFNVNFGGGFNIYLNSGGATFSPTDIVPAANEWNHVALVRSGSTVSVYLNGVASATTTTNSATLGYNSIAYIGGLGTQASGSMNGYITDFRVVNGSAVYTSNFTPPIERLTAITNTSVLACHLPYIADGSTNNKNLTSSGTLSTETFAPYDYSTYSAADHGGSTYFDGSGDYLHMPQTSLDLGSDNFCVEAWVYTTSTANQAIVGSYRYADGVGSWNLNVNYNSNKVRFFIRHSGGTVIDGQFESGTFPTNQWVHVAVTRDGANLRAFINGIQAGSTNTSLGSSSIDNAVTTYRIGASNDNNIYWNGNIEDVRVVRGAAVYTADFTPPTAPLTAITNTSLLLKGTNAGIIDKSQSVKTITLNGDVKSSTTQSKYLTSSMYFDGSGDRIQLPQTSLNLSNADFTVEAWVYTTATSQQTIVGSLVYSNGTGSWLLTVNYNSNKVRFFMRHGGGTIQDAQFEAGTFPTNAWTHVAVTRDGSNIRAFINGTQAGTTNTALGTNAIDNALTNYYIGDNQDGNTYWNGYISDVRVTKGLARYTANFTPPTSALLG